MLASVRALLANVIDYAGLFPPARLSMDEAIRSYAHCRQGPDRWMLGRFVCPAARLAELSKYRDELFVSGTPFTFAVVGRGGRVVGEFLENLNLDLQDIAQFIEFHGNR